MSLDSSSPARFQFASRIRSASLLAVLLLLQSVTACGPGRGAGARRGPRKTTPLVFKQHVPNVSEHTLGASGLAEGRIARSDPRFNDLVVNSNPDIMFKDEEGTGADRIMSQRCRDKLNILALSVRNQWPGVRLRVTEAWDEDGIHSVDSLHYEGRAVDVTTSDRDRSKYGTLARLAVEAGFDWVYFESRDHIHCSVKSDSSIAARNGGCFPPDATVQLESGSRVPMSELSVGDRVLSVDTAGRPIYDDVIAFIHRDPHVIASFVSIATLDGHRVALTPDHLIYATTTNLTTSDVSMTSRFAGNLRPADDRVYVIEAADTKSVGVAMVTQVSTVVGRGVFAPLTNTGNIVVDGVVTSCYASLNSHTTAHVSMAPLRLAAHLQKAWLGDFADKQSMDHKPGGVHWFAGALRSVAGLLLPWSCWYDYS